MEKIRGGVMVAAAALWTVSLVLMIVATALDGDTILAHWSLLVGLWASVVTAWALIDYQRHRVETIAYLLSREQEPEGLRSMR